LLHALAKPERYPAILMPLLKLLIRLPIASSYWDGQLRANGAYDQRSAMPFWGG